MAIQLPLSLRRFLWKVQRLVIAELESLLEDVVGDKALEAALMWDFGCAYNPAIDGLTEREWLLKILAIMKEDVRRRKVTG